MLNLLIMASVRAHHYAASLLIGAVVLATFAWAGFRIPTVEASCGTGEAINLSVPAPGQPISGTVTLTASTLNSNPQPSAVTFMITAPNPSPVTLGQATQSPVTAGTWVLPWNSATQPNNSYQFVAVAQYGTNTTLDCPSTPISANIINAANPSPNTPPTPTSATPQLSVAIYPNVWNAGAGTAASNKFTVNGNFTDPQGTTPVTPANGATFLWRTNAGTINSSTDQAVTLTATSQPGTYNIGVQVTMMGLSATAQGTVTLTNTPKPTPGASVTPSPSPSGTPMPPASYSYNGQTYQLSSSEAQQLTSNPTIFHPTTATNSDPYLAVSTLGCLQMALGSAYEPIAAGTTAPQLSQRLAADDCFTGSNKIPATLAPIEPTVITQIPTETDVVSIGSVSNETISGKDGTKIKAIVVSGVSTPNSSLFVYVFSDPMVLRAQTDSQGKWTYVLVNPLKPGHHEIYAVSQKDSANFVRTPAVPITVAAAATNSSTPSLVIDGPLQPAQVTFGIASLLMLGLAIFLLIRLSRHGKVIPATQPTPTLIQPATAPASAPLPTPTDDSSHGAT